MKGLPFFITLFTLSFFVLTGCGGGEVSEDVPLATPTKVDTSDDTPSGMDKDAIVTSIDGERKAIELAIADVEPVTISTDSLREKISQKWSKMHVYTIDGNVRRIKTYPHEGISTRTEEFYFKKGKLILAVVEDKGTEADERGVGKDNIDKLFYYENGEFVTAVFKNEDKEDHANQSEKLELQDEAAEYVAIFEEYQQQKN